ncbi:TetR family transcriptional regulator [Rhizobiales bacterium RZME27]|uniref:TetR family transcriptional regulator n=1 Tax=Endobacterium cereale TaxID=2663029 RepID=A0A6A8AAR9_9HYPH|nr:TetR/AcrR family transcriptional regulator [Endobacterium cereale]MEB2846144.1 TetR/AcrR family transcriptional regulator [Endobacterium cereale]MQY48355.1 TetR family transcriptional regulator [Endobacterium cereale]
MRTTKILKARGRPRAFDMEDALAKAQALFRARGYDALSVADLTEAIGINPPSFYSAFGSKSALYGQVLQRYAELEGIDLEGPFAAGVSLAEGVRRLLRQAATNYGAGNGTGCMVIEGARGGVDAEACRQARRLLDQTHDMVHAGVSRHAPEQAEMVTDYVMATLSGLSASARNGLSGERLLRIADIASGQLAQELADEIEEKQP